MFFRRRSVILVALITGLLISASRASGPSFSVSFPKSRSEKPLDGRIFLLLSSDPSAEPRMQINDSVNTQMIFGVDVDGMQPGQAVVVDDSAAGYPIRSLRDVPPGDYYVQAVLHRYETFHRSDGHTVKLPMDRGEGQHWNIAPGNLYSAPRKITLGASAGTIAIVVDQEIPPIPPPQDTKYIRHLKIQSVLLTKFWGRPIFLSANVLVPEGFDEHPERSFSAHHQRRPLQRRFRRLSHRAARSQPEARLQRALPHFRLQPHSAGGGLQVLSSSGPRPAFRAS